MAQANLGHVRDTITGIERVSGTEGQGNVVYKVVTELNPAGVGTFTVHNGSDVYQSATDGAAIAHHSGETPSKIYYYQDGSGNYRVAQNGFKDTAGTHSPNVRVTNLTTGLSYVAHYGTGASFSYNEDLDVPAYINFDRTKYNTSTSGYQSSICDAAYAYYKSLSTGAYQKAYEAQGYTYGQIPEEKWFFTAFTLQSASNKPTLYGFHSKKGFFEAWKNAESDASWNIAYNAPQRYGPYTTIADMIADLNGLRTSGIPFNVVSTSVVKVSSGGGGTVYTTKQGFLYYEYNASNPSSSAADVFYINSSGVMTKWLNSTDDGEIYLMVDSAEVYTPA